MRILYIFPHPDDESFGPAAVISAQLREGHEVFLLTLTRGGATSVRHTLGLDIDQMGDVRYAEMLEVEKTLGLTGMTVLDLPDGKLKEMEPQEIERVIADEVERLRPELLISYPVHGISGFQDHLVTHAVVKHVFVDLRSRGADYLKRLAFYTLGASTPGIDTSVHKLHRSRPEEIDCVMSVLPEDHAAMKRALDCYVTYQKMIADSNVLYIASGDHHFEIFGEEHQPPLSDICTPTWSSH